MASEYGYCCLAFIISDIYYSLAIIFTSYTMYKVDDRTRGYAILFLDLYKYVGKYNRHFHY